ncbi:RNA ligase RtcB family protein [Neorhizobium sp. JUb45]|uniref:RNA ligase RtcB family protein n=1 Tax=unclassified Neorhizobium TaxID=2629175 RepID=UPI00104CC037|nr:RNA ligase RtcB family protein [Neorhizobium sp. JUb45]TCR06662.1 release factor H-coupled RctB family protein [Neorhizobium sp. JUb45]
MGTSIGSDSSHTPSVQPAAIHRVFSDRAWIEGAALHQLDEMARLPGAREIVAFPDLHPGKYGATGVALLSDRLHPLLIGNDIGCGMSLFALDLPLRKLKIDKATARLRTFEAQELSDVSARLEEAGLPPELFESSLGTIGGGNHFCELQAIDKLVEGKDLDDQRLYILVHSGSRGFGASVFETMLTNHPSVKDGIDPASEAGQAWLAAHDRCVAWASLNRQLVAERAGLSLGADVERIADIPHNLVRVSDRGFVHHKGAAAVKPGELAPVAGSRASLSHIVRAVEGVANALGAISHGAGRKYDRATMHGRVGKTRSDREQLLRNAWGGVAICDDRNLVIEEAAAAYKDSGHVVADLVAAGLVEPVATLRPLVTYKKAVDEAEADRRDRKSGHREMRRQKNGRR